MSKNNLQLSIILPVYNVRDYLERCIRSLEDQDIAREEYEIIVVNDGSPDDSREVALHLMREFNNITLLDQENQGVSKARNAGIARAKGNYLLFIDPDDYVERNTFKRILHVASTGQAQVTFLGYRVLNSDYSLRLEILNESEKGKVFTGVETYTLSRGDGQTDPDRSVGVLYDREFIIKHNLMYVANVPYLEDGEFLARVLCIAQRCVFEGNTFYIRTTREGSATNSKMVYTKKALDGFFIAASRLMDFQKQPVLSVHQRVFLNQPIAKFVLLPFNMLAIQYRFRDFLMLAQHPAIKGIKLNLDGVKKTYLKYGRVFNASRALLFFYILYFTYKRRRKSKKPVEAVHL
jgi:glycosyltransferase involved in cell wall biosynthesis